MNAITHAQANRADESRTATGISLDLNEQIQRLDDVLNQLQNLGDRLVGPIPLDAKSTPQALPGDVPAPHVPLVRRLVDSRDTLAVVINRINGEIERIDTHL